MTTPAALARTLRWSAFGLALLLAYPLGLGLVAATQTSLSLTAWALLGGLLLLELAALSLPLQRDAASALCGALGVLLLVASGPARACSRPSPPAATTTPDDGERSRVAARPSPAAPVPWLQEERDLVLLAAQLLPGTRWLQPGEAEGLREGLAAGYDAVRADPGDLRARADTWRGRQQPGLIDALAVRSAQGSPEIGLIFLHGFGGNFAWPCWAMARAARQHAGLTLCPSLGTQGDWWSERGLEVAQGAVDALRARGVTRYLLAGLSNGAHGAGTLASALHPAPQGLILISGLPRAAVPATLPTLLVHGVRDHRVSTARARRLAQQHPTAWTYVELAGDHFMWLRRADEVELAIRRWLEVALR